MIPTLFTTSQRRGAALSLVVLAALVLHGASTSVVGAAPVGPQDTGSQTGGLASTDEAVSSLVGGFAVLQTPEQKATKAYEQGLVYLDKAYRLEEELAAAEGAEVGRKAAKAEKLYNRAIGRFEAAIEHMPDFPQALTGLGYASSKVGQHEEALEAYARALAIDPLSPETLEHAGEAYLRLARLEDAKGAYRQLFPFHPARAARLMTAMKRWLQQQREAGAQTAEIEDFARWIEGQGERGNNT